MYNGQYHRDDTPSFWGKGETSSGVETLQMKTLGDKRTLGNPTWCNGNGVFEGLVFPIVFQKHTQLEYIGDDIPR